MGSIQTYVAQ